MRRFIVVLAIIGLLLPVLLAACGGSDKGETDTPTPVATATPASSAAPTGTSAPSATPTSTGPVKIGAISSWSGATAMAGSYLGDKTIKLVEWQVKQQGGILGGRPLEIVKYDSAGSVANAAAGVTKLVLDDNVSIVVWGGVSASEYHAAAQEAEKLKTLFVSMGGLGGVGGAADFKYSVVGTIEMSSYMKGAANAITEHLKSKTVAFLTIDDENNRYLVNGVKQATDAAGIKTVYEQYFNVTTLDFTPYLSRIKYEKPDALVFTSLQEGAITVAKQIMELGGLGDTKVVSTPAAFFAKTKPGAEGWLVVAFWIPGMDYPGSKKFETDFKTVNNSAPDSNFALYYTCLWTAIHSIELAGTDNRAEVASAARSGNLEWDGPPGRIVVDTNGMTDVSAIVAKIGKGGNLTLAW